MSPDTFKKVTNNEMYEKMSNVHDDVLIIKTEIKRLNGSIQFNRKWLWGLTCVFGSGFIFIIGILLK